MNPGRSHCQCFLCLFFQVFENRLKCNSQCKKMDEGSEERRTCENKFCKEIEVRNRENGDDDDDSGETKGVSTRSGTNATKLSSAAN